MDVRSRSVPEFWDNLGWLAAYFVTVGALSTANSNAPMQPQSLITSFPSSNPDSLHLQIDMSYYCIKVTILSFSFFRKILFTACSSGRVKVFSKPIKDQ
jgi:hypothetical protein